MSKPETAKAAAIEEILQVCKNSDIPTTGDLFFALAFRTMSELKSIKAELQIKQ